MNEHSQVYKYIERIQSIWDQMTMEITLSRQPMGGLCHLAVALLLDEHVRAALAAVELPTANELRFALTDTALPAEEQSKEVDESPTEGDLVTVQPLSRWSWYDSDEVYYCLEDVLGGNDLEGLAAHLRLLGYVLRDETVGARLGRVIDVALLESVLEEAMA